MTGRLIGIARRARPRAAMEELPRAHVGLDSGVGGDFRGAIWPGKSGRRQVTVLALEDWDAALADLGQPLLWTARRANLLTQGIRLPRDKGSRLRIGGCILEVTGETDPCSRMDEAADGLKLALMPDWRGGVTAKVVGEGDVALGDQVSIEEVA